MNLKERKCNKFLEHFGAAPRANCSLLGPDLARGLLIKDPWPKALHPISTCNRIRSLRMRQFVSSNKGTLLLMVDGYSFPKEKTFKEKTYWNCTEYDRVNCSARCRLILRVTLFRQRLNTIMCLTLRKWKSEKQWK